MSISFIILTTTYAQKNRADFYIPDTVFVDSLVTIQNNTTGGLTYYWNFCTGNIAETPTGINIGNPNGLLNVPTYSTLIQENGQCYSFVCNQGTQSVIRYNHGGSFANNPSQGINLGSFGLLSDDVEGIQIKKEGNQWIGFICNNKNLVRLNFGSSLTNYPTATIVGPFSELELAHGFILTRENDEWIAFITCTIGNRLVRFRFGNSLLNYPTVENLGTPGNLNAPGQMSYIKENGDHYLFVMNLNSSTISRLDFGNSLLNTPVGTNLGNVCGDLAMGLTIIRDCGLIQGFVTRYISSSYSNKILWRIKFPSGITGPIHVEELGNIGELDRSSLFSELFRQNDTLFVYVSNRGNATRTRFYFPSCSNASPPSSTLFTPPPFSYNQPGTYNIRLLVNEGLPDQSSICKKIVVIPKTPVIVADFDMPDTVCINTPVSIRNLTKGGSTYYWNFCSGNSLANPVGMNIGNPGGMLDLPIYMTQLTDNGVCYSFITNRGTQSVIRYNHGSSFMNDPLSWSDLGSFGMINDSVLGIKICKDQGNWVGFVCNNNRIIRLNFGNSLRNTPVARQFGPYAMLYTAHCIDIQNQDNTWTGYLSCTWGNKFVRLYFGNSLLNDPVLTDLGTPGSMNMPLSFRLVRENNNWYGIVSNAGDNTLTRLAFGNSLLNNPAGENLGVVCQGINPGGISLFRDCGSMTGFQLNYTSNAGDLLWRMDFPTGITGSVYGKSLGNIGNMNRPVHFSEMYRIRDTIILYNTNRDDHSLTRLIFPPCTNASIPSSTRYDPPPVSYNQTGNYNVQLTVNEGMPEQRSICKNITVVSQPLNKYIDTTLCSGDSIWAGGKYQHVSGTFYDTIPFFNSCDSVIITQLGVVDSIRVNLGPDTTLCSGKTLLLKTGVPLAQYLWQNGSTDSTLLATETGKYWVEVAKQGCHNSDTINLRGCLSPIFFPNAFTPNDDGINDKYRPVGSGVLQFSMEIYNRWGERVFETDNFDLFWDGRFNGSRCADGVYFFIAKFVMADSSDESHHAHGSVTLLR